MVISYFGKQFFKVAQGDLVLAFNPIAKESKHKDKISRFGAAIALISAHHPDLDGVETVTHGEMKPFVINGPGDYEVKGIYVRGFLTKGIIDKKELINTVYTLSLDDIKICVLGTLSKEIDAATREQIGTPDILFLPLSSLSPKEASKLALSLEAKIIVPMDYSDEELKLFLKESGEKVEPIDKLTIKKKDLEGKEGEIVVLKY